VASASSIHSVLATAENCLKEFHDNCEHDAKGTFEGLLNACTSDTLEAILDVMTKTNNEDYRLEGIMKCLFFKQIDPVETLAKTCIPF
jgi:hypothetical protein